MIMIVIICTKRHILYSRVGTHLIKRVSAHKTSLALHTLPRVGLDNLDQLITHIQTSWMPLTAKNVF